MHHWRTLLFGWNFFDAVVLFMRTFTVPPSYSRLITIPNVLAHQYRVEFTIISATAHSRRRFVVDEG